MRLIPLQVDTPRWPSGQSTELLSVVFNKKRRCCFASHGQHRQQDLKYKQQFRTKFNNSTYAMGRCWSVPQYQQRKNIKAKESIMGTLPKWVCSNISLSHLPFQRGRMISNTIPLRIWSVSKITPKWMEKRNNRAHLPYNSPVACYQQIKNSDAFSLQTRIKIPSKMYRGKPNLWSRTQKWLWQLPAWHTTQFSDPLPHSFCSSTYVVLWLPRQ